MLDGRVLGASQVEYKPFGKPPLKREIPGMQGFPALNSPRDLIQNCSMVDSCCCNIATKLRATCPALKPRQAAEPSLSPGSLLYALNCFNMSDYMSDEHVLGTPCAPPCRATCPASEPHASPPSHTDHTDHTVIRSYGGLALRHPAAPARPEPPACLPSLQQGI